MTDTLDRDTVIAHIRAALKKRSGKPWSVTGGRGTAWGWIRVQAPPRRLVDGVMTVQDSTELATLLGFDRAHHQGVRIPASSAYYREYLQRARGEEVTAPATPYWD